MGEGDDAHQRADDPQNSGDDGNRDTQRQIACGTRLAHDQLPNHAHQQGGRNGRDGQSGHTPKGLAHPEAAGQADGQHHQGGDGENRKEEARPAFHAGDEVSDGEICAADDAHAGVVFKRHAVDYKFIRKNMHNFLLKNQKAKKKSNQKGLFEFSNAKKRPTPINRSGALPLYCLTAETSQRTSSSVNSYFVLREFS